MKLLVSPLARGAYYDDVLAVALAELGAVFPGASATPETRGPLALVDVDLPETEAPRLAGLSWVQAVLSANGDGLVVLEADPGFVLPDDLVWGAKYRGKTNELATLMALNVARAACAHPAGTVLDPMAGRGTTLLWGLRTGLESWGIEREASAIGDLQRHLKKQTKLHRIKHTLTQGGRAAGAFLDLRVGDGRLRLITGDTREAPELLQRKRFDLVVTDLPYGVQHTGPNGTRDPLTVLKASAAGWAASLVPGGAMALLFNRNLPRRDALIAAFAPTGLEVLPFEAPHRMSESIVRDLLVLRAP